MELVELLLIAAVGTALAAVVLAGLMWTPWLILASLLVLLWVLLKMPIARSTIAAPSADQNSGHLPISAVSSTASERRTMGKAIAPHPTESQPTETPEQLTYRGANYLHHPDREIESDGGAVEQVRVYRGTVYKIYIPSR